MVSNLKSDNASIAGWWIRHDVSKIAIQRQQDGIQFLGLCHHKRIIGIPGYVFLQDKNLVTGVAKYLDDRTRNAVIRKESQTHEPATSNSANSRA